MTDVGAVFEEVFEGYSEKVRGFLRKRIANIEDADEVFQNTFFDFWRALHTFNGKASPYTLLYRVMERRLADYIRGRYRQVSTIGYSLNLENIKVHSTDKEYLNEIETSFNININPLSVLIALTDGETRELLLAIRKTKNRR